ncbi:MAG: hypothetical protein AB2A00_24805, partial [Myxococcota bacterium]
MPLDLLPRQGVALGPQGTTVGRAMGRRVALLSVVLLLLVGGAAVVFNVVFPDAKTSSTPTVAQAPTPPAPA